MKITSSGKNELIDALIKIKPFHLIWVSVVMSMIFTQMIAIPMSIYFNGKVTHDLFITAVVCSFLVCLAVNYIVVGLTARVHESEKRYRRLFEVESDAILLVDSDTDRILDANFAASIMYGYTREELLQLKAGEVYLEPETERHAIVIETHIPFRWHRKKDGTRFPVETASSYFDYQTMHVHVDAIRDITERNKVENMLTRERKFLSAILETTFALIVVIDTKGAIIRYNAECERLTGISSNSVNGQFIWDVFAGPADMSILKLAIHADKDGPFLNSYETNFKAVDGVERTIAWVNSIFCEEEGTDCCIISTGIDVTDRKALEKELIKAASTDKLTHLINRQELDNVILSEMKRAIRYHRSLSIIMFDIDHFKLVNDTYGHLAGDSVLKEVASIVQANLRANDSLGRWGGEEFMVVLPETSIEGARAIADKMRYFIKRNSFVHIEELTASFGVTDYNKGENIDAFVQRVDDALYTAKQSGRDRVVCINRPDVNELIQNVK